MTKRNFPDFLSAYVDYARDGFCPESFHFWTGVSILAAALERKVSLRGGKVHYVPNFYIMLVSPPGAGKSTAIEPGVELIELLRKEHDTNFRIIPEQVTEPALVDMMKIVDRFQVPGLAEFVPQSAGYFYASEASSSALQNVCGDFIATMTAMYDCPKFFRKKLKSDQRPTEIECVCMNMLSGSTFDYLKNLVNATTVMGGFASRVTYVVQKTRPERTPKWGAVSDRDRKLRRELLADLAEIHRLAGPMTPDAGFISAWEAYQAEFGRFLTSIGDPRMESLLARKATHVTKLAMLLSVSESSSLIVTGKHFEQAASLIEDVTMDAGHVLSTAIIANKESQEGMTELIIHSVKESGGRIRTPRLKRMITQSGNDLNRFQPTFDMLIASGRLRLTGSDTVELLVDTD